MFRHQRLLSATLWGLFSVSAVGIGGLASSSVWAQKKSTTKESAASKKEEAAQSQTAKKPEASKKEERPDAVSFKADDVWDVDIFKREDHKILVIQDRKYTKAGRFELGVMGGVTSSTPFYKSYSYGVQADYYFSEYFGIDAFYSGISSNFSADANQLNDVMGAREFPIQKEYQKPLYLWGVGLIWAPIYGKFAFFRQSIIHFDFFSTIGMSVFKTESNVTRDDGSLKTQVHPGSLISVGMRIFATPNFSIRLDIRNNIYKTTYEAVTVETKPQNNLPSADVVRQAFHYTLGTSYIF